jgi:hypothetical protein
MKGGEETNTPAPAADAANKDAQLTDEEKVQLKANFDAIDADSSGTLDLKEFNEAMKLAFAEHPDKPEMPSDEALEAEFKKCDTDNSGTIELEEFYAVFTAIKRGEDGGLLGKMGGGFAAVLGDVADGAVAGAKFAWTPFQFAWDVTGGKVVEAVSGEGEKSEAKEGEAEVKTEAAADLTTEVGVLHCTHTPLENAARFCVPLPHSRPH